MWTQYNGHPACEYNKGSRKKIYVLVVRPLKTFFFAAYSIGVRVSFEVFTLKV